MSELLSIIKKAAVEAVEASDPAGITYGTVVSDSPLLVSIDQKLTLSQEFLILTKNVRNYTVEVTDGSVTGAAEGRTSVIRNALKKGDALIMIKQQGGQKYIVLDKIESQEV